MVEIYTFQGCRPEVLPKIYLPAGVECCVVLATCGIVFDSNFNLPRFGTSGNLGKLNFPGSEVISKDYK
jgi:hypothetical protein